MGDTSLPDVERKPCYIRHRYVVVMMCCLGVFNTYTTRNALALVIWRIVEKQHNETKENYYCKMPKVEPPKIVTNPDLSYPWDEKIQETILISFFWGYMITHIPGGFLVDQYGAKYVIVCSILGAACTCLLTPVVILKCNGNWIYLLMLRVTTGLLEGPIYPSVISMLAQWIPDNEKTATTTIVFSGAPLGFLVCNVVGREIIYRNDNWTYVFYVFGITSIVWCILWKILCSSSPERCPLITEAEKHYLHEELSSDVRLGKKKIPWLKIFSSLPVWAFIVTHVGVNWAWFTMSCSLPKYLHDVLNLTILGNPVNTGLPWVMMLLAGVSCAFLSDWLIRNMYVEKIAVRKILNNFGSMGAGIFAITATYTGCSEILAPILLAVGMAFLGPFVLCMRVNILDLSPNFAGTLLGLANGLSIFPAIVAPYLVQNLTQEHNVFEWRYFFWISLLVYTVTNIFYTIFGNATLQQWNKIDDVPKQNKAFVFNKT